MFDTDQSLLEKSEEVVGMSAILDETSLADDVQPPDVQLEAELKTAKEEAAEWQDRLLRKAAEFENYRKRVGKDKADAEAYAQSKILLEFLPVVDACARALKYFGMNPERSDHLQQYRDGVELLYRQLIDAIHRAGAVAIESEGKPFDPYLHEAVSREENSEFQEGIIIREVLKGYMFKEKLLRPAQVIVAACPQNNKVD